MVSTEDRDTERHYSLLMDNEETASQEKGHDLPPVTSDVTSCVTAGTRSPEVKVTSGGKTDDCNSVIVREECRSSSDRDDCSLVPRVSTHEEEEKT